MRTYRLFFPWKVLYSILFSHESKAFEAIEKLELIRCKQIELDIVVAIQVNPLYTLIKLQYFFNLLTRSHRFVVDDQIFNLFVQENKIHDLRSFFAIPYYKHLVSSHLQPMRDFLFSFDIFFSAFQVVAQENQSHPLGF